MTVELVCKLCSYAKTLHGEGTPYGDNYCYQPFGFDWHSQFADKLARTGAQANVSVQQHIVHNWGGPDVTAGASADGHHVVVSGGWYLLRPRILLTTDPFCIGKLYCFECRTTF